MVCRLVMFCGSVDVMEEQLLSCRYLHSSPVELRLLKMYLPLNQLTQYIYNKFPFLFFFSHQKRPPKSKTKYPSKTHVNRGRWLTKTTPEKSWRGVEGPEVLSSPDIDGDEMTAFDLKWSKGQKMHVELLMKTQQGFKIVGKLFATCKTGYHLNVKVHMFSQDEVRLVKGQLGIHSGGHTAESLFQESGQKLNGQELRTDQDFQTKTDWMQLGGSPDASTYLREVDDEGPAIWHEFFLGRFEEK